jgi:hypothetical protein
VRSVSCGVWYRCVKEVDVSRGIPCPSCSGPFRSEDKLLKEQEALPDWHVGNSLTRTSSSSDAVSTSANGTGRSGSDGGGSRCGYIYCDMAAQLAGADAPWTCDVCGATVADDTAELWGRCVCCVPDESQRYISIQYTRQQYILT